MLKGIVFSALLSGVLLGIFLTALHAVTVYPIIIKAETYVVENHSQSHSVDQVAQPRAQYTESTRLFLSLLSNSAMSIAFAILLNIGFTLHPFEHWRKGAYWGLAGLAAFFVIPMLIYGPTLPGAIEAAHFIRQVWWMATVEASIIGIALAVFPPSMWIKLQGVLLIAIAFFVGAPSAAEYLQTPESLVNQFYVMTLVTNSIYWLVLGVVAAYFHQYFSVKRGAADVR